MSNKRYYWLKLKNDFFDNIRIKKLRKIAGGDTFTIIYLKLQLLSLRDEGKIYFEGVESTLEEELSLRLDEDIEDVKMTLIYLTQNNLLEQSDVDEYELPEAKECMGSEAYSTERSRRCREKQKMLQCNANATLCNEEKEIEKEKEIDKNIYDLVEQELQMTLSPMNYEKINNLIDKYGEDKFKDALSISSNANKKSLNYVEGVLKNNVVKKTIEPVWLGKEISSEEMNKEELKELEDMFINLNGR